MNENLGNPDRADGKELEVYKTLLEVRPRSRSLSMAVLVVFLTRASLLRWLVRRRRASCWQCL